MQRNILGEGTVNVQGTSIPPGTGAVIAFQGSIPASWLAYLIRSMDATGDSST
jgi:hypothetical protein